MNTPTLALTAIVLVSAACASTSEEPLATAVGASSSAESAGVSPERCVEEGFPCDLSETPPELIARTAELIDAASEHGRSGDLSAVVTFLEDQPDVVEVFGRDRAVVFRVEGASFAWIVDHSDLAPDVGARNLGLATPWSAPLPQPISVVGDDTTGDGEIDQRDQKRALVLAPYMWDFAPWDESDHLAERLETMPAYEGNVTFRANRNEGDRNISIDDWQSFDDYDAIFISTHGFRACADPEGTQECQTVVQTGIELNLLDIDVGGFYTGTYPIGLLNNQSSNAVIEIGVGPGFMRFHYPGGLDDTLLSLSACETGLIPGDEFAAAAGGDNFVMMAWTEVVPSDAAFSALGLFAEQLALGLTSELAYQEVVEAGLASAESGDHITTWEHISPNSSEVRLIELPTLTDDGQPMLDGSRLDSDRISGTPGDGEADTVRFDLELVGIDEPARYRVRYEVDGQDTGNSYSLAGAVSGELPYAYSVTHVVDVGFDLPDGDDILVVAIVELPEGGESRYSVEVIVSGADAVITVGGTTWEFELIEPPGFPGCIVAGDTVIVSGAVDGDLNRTTFNAELHRDGRGLIHVEDNDSGDLKRWLAAADRSGMTVLHEIPDGDSQIDEMTFEGTIISGTGTFIDGHAYLGAWRTDGDFPAPVGGSFEIRCGLDLG